MIEKKIADLLNKQINREFFSAYLYLGISNYYQEEGLDGFSNWYKIQAKEEMDHANLMIQYLQNNNKKIELELIEKPETDYPNIQEGTATSLKHEQFITEEIKKIYGTALELQDYQTVEFLSWFLKEQVEEEKNAEDQIKKLSLFGSEQKALYMLDKDLAARIYAPPSLILE